MVLNTLVALFVLIVGGAVTTAGVALTNCSLANLKPVDQMQNSFLYAADGSPLGSIQTDRNRQVVGIDAISPWMPKAVVAIEDRRFYHHGGLDYIGILRAALADIRARKTLQGASTITQQLVRNLYIPNHSEPSFKRKIKEACLARKLNGAWSKDRILTAYMNQVFYGQNAYGVEAASETYFSKHAKKLTLAQASLLAGLPQAPSTYDPFVNKAAALARRNEVLKAMLKNGDISQNQYNETVAQPIKLKLGKIFSRIREPNFFSYVKSLLIDKYGAATVRSGGLKVYTTINPRFQRDAESAIRGTLYYRTDPAAAVVALDPRNGAIRAMTGIVPNQPNNQYNLATQGKRQPGSTFKSIVLTTAISQGMNPYTTYYTSAPFYYQPSSSSPPWIVHTYSDQYVGSISVANATLQSDNTVYAQLTLDAGPANVAAMAYKLGVRTSKLNPQYASIGLGSEAVSPLEMASVYATLAAGGIHSNPIAVTKVVFRNGDIDRSLGKPKRERVIPDWVAYEVTKILEQNVLYGTGTGANFGRPEAGKTGTTENHADAWFCGYTPTLTAAVWVGYPSGQIPMYDVHGISVAGGTFPATIWRLFMEPALANVPPLDFASPHTSAQFTYWAQHGYGYSGSSGNTTTTSTTTTQAVTTRPRQHTQTTPTPPPTTTSEPPPTTTSEPPTTTSDTMPATTGPYP